ncbi:MAG: zinc-binding dehydrogenase [Pseudomonadota bacterium]
MRAVLMERGRLWVDEIPDPEPGPGEVLVRTIACGVCGSDLHAVRHTDTFVATSREAGGAFKLDTFDPVVLGHEFCAEILDYGPDCARTLPVGTHVCAPPMLLRKPPAAVGYSPLAPGGFGERMLLSEPLLLPVPGGLDASLAALTEPMAVGLHAVRKARLTAQDAAVVVGCGPVGLAVITALKAQGFGPVIASDFSPGRRALAQTQGADILVDPAESDPLQHSERRTRSGCVVFECVGVPGMLDQLFLSAPQDARLVVVGVCLEPDTLRPLIAINKELNVQFVLGYSTEEFAETLTGIADGRFRIEPLITDRVPLEQVEATFARLAQPEAAGKVLVEPGA